MANLFDLYKLIKENEVSAYTIYLDMDGVIADFDQRFIDVSGMTPDEYRDKYGLKEFWNLIDEKNVFPHNVKQYPLLDNLSYINDTSQYSYPDNHHND